MTNPFVSWVKSLEWRRGFHDWYRTDAITWIFIFKTLVAGFTTLGLAMCFELPQPKVAVATVFVVMQVQRGPVLAKAFYRLAGTLIGACITVLLVATSPQDSVLLLIFFSVWIAFCCSGAQWHRNVKGYGFVLAGYTTAVIGLPLLSHPNDVFISAIWRTIEISLGLTVSTIVTATVFPHSAQPAMLEAMFQRFGVMSALIASTLKGQGTASEHEAIYLRFAAEAAGLEGLRSLTAFEDPHARNGDRRFRRLNKEFMAVCTKFHAFQLYLNSREPDHVVCDQLDFALLKLSEVCSLYANKALTCADATKLLADVLCLQQGCSFFSDAADEGEFITDAQKYVEVLTAFQMLNALLNALVSYLNTHSCLASREEHAEQWGQSYQAHTNWLAGLAAGIRGGVVVLTLGLFWLHTGWPSGAIATLIGASTVALAATTPTPRVLAFQMALGTLVGASLGMIENFWIYPLIDGFPLLCMVLTPVIGIGAFLVSRPRWFGYGVGVLVFFAIGSVPDNPIHYDPAVFVNDYLGMILGMLVSAVAGAVILPPDQPWLVRRLTRDLRTLVVTAVAYDLDGLSNSFESRVRDIVHQACGLTGSHPEMRREILTWMFAVLEVGHAVIEIREQLVQDKSGLCRKALEGLADLFTKPSQFTLDTALDSVSETIAMLLKTGESISPTVSYLEFIRISIVRLPLAQA